MLPHRSNLILALAGLLVIIQAFYSCSSDPSTSIPNQSGNTIPGTTCFQRFDGLDTVHLAISQSADSITGTMDYYFSAKENIKGTLKGSRNGDTIFALYTYESRDYRAIRELAFLIEGETVTQVNGPQTLRNGKMVFVSKDKIEFGVGTIMKRVDCKD